MSKVFLAIVFIIICLSVMIGIPVYLYRKYIARPTSGRSAAPCCVSACWKNLQSIENTAPMRQKRMGDFMSKILAKKITFNYNIKSGEETKMDRRGNYGTAQTQNSQACKEHWL